MSGLTELPEKTDESIGREVDDRPRAFTPVLDLNYDVPASTYERIKSLLINIANRLGLGDGSTPDSIEEKLAEIDDSLASTGRVLFKWNGTDTSQFDTPIIEDTGSGATAVPSVSVVAGTLSPNKNVLKLIATGQIDSTKKAGVFLPVKTASLALGSTRRYVVRMVVGQRNTTSGADWRSCGVGFLAGLVGSDWYVQHCGPTDNSQTGESSVASMQPMRIDGGAAAASSVLEGGPISWMKAGAEGYVIEVEVDGVDGSGPKCRIWAKGFCGVSDTTVRVFIQDEAGLGLAAFPAAWNGLALNRLGITMFVRGNGGNIVNPYYEIMEFTVFKHPMDE